MKNTQATTAPKLTIARDDIQLGRIEAARLARVAAQVGITPREALRRIIRNSLGFGFAPGGKSERLMDACNSLA